jgi:hypothetical protein
VIVVETGRTAILHRSHFHSNATSSFPVLLRFLHRASSNSYHNYYSSFNTLQYHLLVESSQKSPVIVISSCLHRIDKEVEWINVIPYAEIANINTAITATGSILSMSRFFFFYQVICSAWFYILFSHYQEQNEVNISLFLSLMQRNDEFSRDSMQYL